jgi:hypothetical protein
MGKKRNEDKIRFDGETLVVPTDRGDLRFPKGGTVHLRNAGGGVWIVEDHSGLGQPPVQLSVWSPAGSCVALDMKCGDEEVCCDLNREDTQKLVDNLLEAIAAHDTDPPENLERSISEQMGVELILDRETSRSRRSELIIPVLMLLAGAAAVAVSVAGV